MFFKPLEKVLQPAISRPPRARENWPQKSLEQAAAKTATTRTQLRAAKAEMYQAQEQLHKQLPGARSRCRRRSAQERRRGHQSWPKRQLAADVEAAKASLGRG